MPDEVEINEQKAPYPILLDEIIRGFKYKAGWRFRLRRMVRDPGCSGLTLDIVIDTPDSYAPEKVITVSHRFPVPPATYNFISWSYWLLECISKVDRHEAMENFIVDGERIFAPHHANGNDPYMTFALGTYEQTRIKGGDSE